MSELATTSIVGIGGFVTGLVFGAVAQRTNFCTMGAISDLVLMGDGRRFRAWMLAMAVAIIGTHALHFSGAIDINKSIYLTSQSRLARRHHRRRHVRFRHDANGRLRQQDAGAARRRQFEVAGGRASCSGSSPI